MRLQSTRAEAQSLTTQGRRHPVLGHLAKLKTRILAQVVQIPNGCALSPELHKPATDCHSLGISQDPRQAPSLCTSSSAVHKSCASKVRTVSSQSSRS